MYKLSKILIVTVLALSVGVTVQAKTLSVGSTGQEVAQLQTWLINNGYTIPLIESGRASKGYFGTQTEDAVKMYQEDKGVALTGSIDSENYGNSVKLGSVTGPDLYTPYWNVNGFRQWFVRQPMNKATTTLCAMRSPTSATTTVHFVSFQILTGTSTAATIDIGTSTTAYSTTTNLVAAKSIASGATGYSYWTSAGGSVDNAKMSPGEYVNVKTAGAGVGGYTYTGFCQAAFIEL